MIGYVFVACFCMAWPTAACSLHVPSRAVASVTLLVAATGMTLDAYVPEPMTAKDAAVQDAAAAFAVALRSRVQ